MIVLMCKPEFEPLVLSGVKIHTIRPQRKRPIKYREELSLRVWTGLPYRSKQREFFRGFAEQVEGIRIHRDGVESKPGTLACFWMPEYKEVGRFCLHVLARDDGFPDWKTMKAWFEKNHGLAEPFEGTLIGWKARPPVNPAQTSKP